MEVQSRTTACYRQCINTWRRFGERCQQRAGALLAHVSTAEVARDLDLLRQAVGDGALTSRRRSP
jgi:hypothetical protein